ncbi:hypothetical protein KIN20_028715 [Parelaphostrongylus tenuis]|uniref:Uncharacterized protein n=1 Tax=Parelaphostrongylus tenuis TaxID=148309 RepID=A0AAD5R1J4_PARTN|nr:hypothetical protein KIN20_028715 [Parelaphostrongylus tenuis]
MSPSDVHSAAVDHVDSEPNVTIECTGAQNYIETAILVRLNPSFPVIKNYIIISRVLKENLIDMLQTTRSGGVVVLVGVGEFEQSYK